jgi:hypothetical protein
MDKKKLWMHGNSLVSESLTTSYYPALLQKQSQILNDTAL